MNRHDMAKLKDHYRAQEAYEDSLYEVDIENAKSVGKFMPSIKKNLNDLTYGIKKKKLENSIIKARKAESDLYKKASRYVKAISCEVCGHKGLPTNFGKCTECGAIGGKKKSLIPKSEPRVDGRRYPTEYFGGVMKTYE